jgi:tripartite-type tricarboxylate transporter receptor subunit TctC
MRLRGIAAAFAALAALCATARAQDAYPSKTITMIVPFAAGGSTDVIGRLVAEGLRTALGQPVVVDNRGGAGGSLGTAAIAKAPPDGYTIGMGTASTLAINPATYKSLPFDVLDDLSPIGNIAAVPNIMSVHPGVQAANMAEFITLAKSQPGKLSYASPGHGSVGHLLGEQFKLATGTDLLHVPYRGMGPALNDAIGGQVQVIYDNLPTSLELVKAGKLRGLGLSGEKRAAGLPDVPTFGELKLDDINWMAFFGLIAPKDTPAAIVQRLNEALVKVLAMPELRDKLRAQQAIVVGNSPEAFKAEIAREVARFKRAVVAAKIELN